MIEFQLLLKPSSFDCNLNCTYCFYKRVQNIYPEIHPRMNFTILEEIIKKYSKVDMPNYIFIWQGGEPTLLGINFFKKVIELQLKYFRRGKFITNSLQTNGILINKDWCTFFKRYNFFIGISLDGPKEIHDFYRKKTNGEGTWDRVMNTIELLKKFNINFNILCVISKANVRKPRELFNFFKRYNLTNLQFIPAFERFDKNRKINFSPSPDEYAKFLCDIFDLWIKEDFNQIHILTFERILERYLGIQYDFCPFGKNCPNYLVIEYNGDIYPCDFFVDKSYKLGNIKDEKNLMEFLHLRNEKFGLLKQKLDQECLKCHWLELCNGGCIKDRYIYNNNFEKKSYYCKAYKIFFTHSYKWYYKISDKLIDNRNLSLKRVVKKINRNDPCPCGSGLKYKKCHGNK